MSEKIGDVYHGGSKIGELRRTSGGGGGCLSIIGLVVILIIGAIMGIQQLINQARFGADSPAHATMTAEARNADATSTAQAALCISARPPSDNALADMAKSAYEADNRVSVLSVQVQSKSQEMSQDGCYLYVCATTHFVITYSGDYTEADVYRFEYSLDTRQWAIKGYSMGSCS